MPILTADDLLAAPPARYPSIVGDGVLPEQGKFLLIGETEAGKSVLAFDMAIRLVLQKPWFNASWKKKSANYQKEMFPVHRPCKVLYIDTELGQSGCYERMRLFADAYKLSQIGGLGERMVFATEVAGLRLHNVPTLDKKGQGGFDRLRALIEEQKPDVLFLDPLVEFHLLDENSSELHLALSQLNALQHELNFATVIPHHASGKDFYTQMGKKVEKDDIDRARGHSSLVGWADTVLVIERSDTQQARCFVELRWAKCRRGRKPPNGICFVDLERMFVDWVCVSRQGGALEPAAKQAFLDKYNKAFPPVSEEYDI